MALLNIYIPRIMGDLINVIAKVNEVREPFLEKVKTPALKLIGMYIVQVCIHYNRYKM